METILWVMGHEEERERPPDGCTVVRPPTPEGLGGLALASWSLKTTNSTETYSSTCWPARDSRRRWWLTVARRWTAWSLTVRLVASGHPHAGTGRIPSDGSDPEARAIDWKPPPRHRSYRASKREDREQCLRAGMDEYLTKPFKAAKLWAAIERVVKRYPPQCLERLNLIDPQVLLAACGADAAMLQKMCRSLEARVRSTWRRSARHCAGITPCGYGKRLTNSVA